MADTYTARKQRDMEVVDARNKAREQQDALRQGGRRTPGFEPAERPHRRHSSVEPYAGPGAPVKGGAQDDPNVKIEVGPDGTILRRRRGE